ncbi:MAG: GNAT family N-acetyltransferase [Chloroflexaceae bacterium]|nr:GNAT family N-acetyltransferase [Chloroflexaceae bacterium]
MTIIAETQRLLIRPWQPETDANQALAIYGDRLVTHFIKTKADSLEAQISILKRWVEQAKQLNNGTGLWPVRLKETDAIIGTVALIQLPISSGKLTDTYEIGWHLKRAAWGQGYATEAAKGILGYGFKQLRLPAIHAATHPHNLASIRVTQRLNMQPLGRTNAYYDTELELFKLEAIAWLCSRRFNP